VRVALEVADDQQLAAFAERVAADRVDPGDIDDHLSLHGDPLNVLERLRAARDRRVNIGGIAWIVTADDKVVGYISARISGDEAETFSVVVADMQRLGIGRAARRLALDGLQQRGVKRAVSVSRPGSPSSAVSRRLGYRSGGREARTAPNGTEVELERWEIGIEDRL
jgi:hypothetical protein